jgi:hypothetical protein
MEPQPPPDTLRHRRGAAEAAGAVSAAARGAAGRAAAASRQFRASLTLAEASGALGDLATFLPIAVGLSSQVGISFGTTLLFTGA